MSGLSDFAEHLTAKGYHPRSNEHSNVLCLCVLHDLIEQCPQLAREAFEGRLVFDLNFKIQAGVSDWNIDLVIGTPPGMPIRPESGERMRRMPPSSIRVALEVKSLMTEHRKAVRNRLRDFDAFHSHVHAYDSSVVAGGVILVNIAEQFRSPLRKVGDLTIHKKPHELVKQCIGIYRSLPVRSGSTEGGLDAFCAIVLDFRNIPGKKAFVHFSAPAPQVGDPFHYDAFVQRICNRYIRNWL